MNRRGILTIGGGVLLVALLVSGCSAAPDASSSGPPSTSDASSPTPNPTVAPAAAPGPRVQLKCADLYSLSAVAELIEAHPTVISDETTAPPFVEQIASAQLGELSCAWIGPDGTEISAAEQLAIDIAPDSAAAYASHAAADLKPPAKGVSLPGTAGDESGYWCLAFGSSSVTCSAQMLVGTYWTSVTLAAADPTIKTKVAVATVSTRMKSVLERVLAQLAAAPKPVPQWVAPTTTPPAFCDASTSTATIRSAFGTSGYTLAAANPRYLDAGTAGTLGTSATCSWTDPRGKAIRIDIQLLAGGSWVFPGFRTTPYADGFVRTYAPTTITGATSADLGCSEGYCGSSFAVGTTLVHVDFGDLGAAKNRAALGQLATAIEAS